jgi:hypothetical protein
MQTTIAFAALVAAAVAAKTPTASAPPGFATDYAGTFQITAINTTVLKRDIIEKVRQSSIGRARFETDKRSVHVVTQAPSSSPSREVSSPTPKVASLISLRTINSNSTLRPAKQTPSTRAAFPSVAMALWHLVARRSSTSA